VELAFEPHAGGLLIRPAGTSLAAADLALIGTRLQALRDQPGARVVLDATGLTALNGAAVRVLLLAARQLTQAGGWLALAGTSSNVRRALQVSGFDRDFVLTESVEAALLLAPAGDGSAVLAERLLNLLGRPPQLPETPVDPAGADLLLERLR